MLVAPYIDGPGNDGPGNDAKDVITGSPRLPESAQPKMRSFGECVAASRQVKTPPPRALK